MVDKVIKPPPARQDMQEDDVRAGLFSTNTLVLKFVHIPDGVQGAPFFGTHTAPGSGDGRFTIDSIPFLDIDTALLLRTTP